MTETAPRRTNAATAGRRRQIVRAARECFVENGVDATSLRQIAARAGITHVGLLHHFPNKDALVVAVLQERDQEDQERASEVHEAASSTEAGRAPLLSQIMRDHQTAPESLRLWMELMTSASRPEHPAHDYFVQRYADLRGLFSALLRRRVDAGGTWPSVDADLSAALFVAVMDGLQVQWLLDRDVPVTEALEHFLELLLRPGVNLSEGMVDVVTQEAGPTAG